MHAARVAVLQDLQPLYKDHFAKSFCLSKT